MPFSGLRPGPGGEQRRGRSPSTSVWNRLDFQRRDQLPDAVPSPVGALNDENQLDFQRAVRGGSRDDEMPFPSSARRSCVLRGGVRADITRYRGFYPRISFSHSCSRASVSYLSLVPVLHRSCLMYFLVVSCRAFSGRHGLAGTKCNEVLCCSRFY